MAFVQSPPELGNQYLDDRVLRSYLSRVLPEKMLSEIEPELIAMGERAGGELYRLQLADLGNEPVLTQWDAWGNRIDRIEVTPLWREAGRIAAESGLVAIAHERRHAEFSRVHQFALVYLFTPSADLYSCPLAMSDGAACALAASGNRALIERALPHLTSRDPENCWTSGQWMTEAGGGSDAGSSETVAREEGGTWRLYGRKWFASAVTSQMALALARPEGNPPGSRGVALFYLETRDAMGHSNRIFVHRLKDKLGTRKLPTAEVTLDGTPAEPVRGTDDGVKNIVPMLNVTRIWNAIAAVSLMRRGLALSRDYARKRIVFGAPLADKPLHLDTLAGVEAEFEGAFHLAFYVAELLGRVEAQRASEPQRELLRLLTPVTKLLTARQCVAAMSEIIESFGGAGYVEDTGLPALLRDAQALPIWEGTTNVLALDTVRALRSGAGLAAFRRELGFILQGLRERELVKISARVEKTAEVLQDRLRGPAAADAARLVADARRVAFTLGRTMELALLARHAQWCLDHERDRRAAAAARRFAGHGFNLLADFAIDDARLLARDEPG